MLLSAAQSWVATPAAARLLAREFEDGTVCFDPQTSETLLLSHLSSFLLELWAQHPGRPMVHDELLAEVLAVDDSTADKDVAAELVAQALNELQRAGLVTHGGGA
ncbi:MULTISPECIES: hypothetical protein [Roseateles]|uniref:PqqD family protein of HPr-rel-A system n=1 Tax=Pelomonas aquatica TaxID=431058 RepID=A0ABU1ZHS7_9BURK|nr:MULTISPECIES: hypothetical protein [Roseateles]KQY85319.1 hypothetical protein ASD35_22085 [Pelomonas sp. Root1444]MDR7299550.1 PqqD family protein of HPr-rel-A system [Pelomonas aquatica]